jgi:hypothetical protein
VADDAAGRQEGKAANGSIVEAEGGQAAAARDEQCPAGWQGWIRLANVGNGGAGDGETEGEGEGQPDGETEGGTERRRDGGMLCQGGSDRSWLRPSFSLSLHPSVPPSLCLSVLMVVVLDLAFEFDGDVVGFDPDGEAGGRGVGGEGVGVLEGVSDGAGQVLG